MPVAAGVAAMLWTARLAVGAYCAAVILLIGGSTGRSARGARWAWTAGFVLLLSHALLAMHFVHHWSQAEAWAHTAKQTRAVAGLDWGGGLVINDLFLAWWGIDVLAWWLPATFPWRSRRGYQIALHSVFAFLVFNATVVFGPAWWRGTGAAVLLLIAAAANLRVRRSVR